MRVSIHRSLILFFFLMTSSLWSQSARWELPGGSLQKNRGAVIQLIFENCSPKSIPVLQQIKGLKFGDTPSQSRQYNIVNFKKTEKLTLSYSVLATQEGQYQIPAMTIPTNKGDVKIDAFTIPVLAIGQSASSTSSSNDGRINSKIRIIPESIYQGQVFTLRYEILLPRNLVQHVFGLDWEDEKILSNDWPEKPQRTPFRNGQDILLGYERQSMISEAGLHEIPGVIQDVEVRTNARRGFFSPFFDTERISIASDPLSVDVKPLPPASTDFSGAVGSFTLEYDVTPRNVKAGEPVTCSIKLKGKGNWPMDFEKPDLTFPQDVRVIQPDAQMEQSPDNMFQAEWTRDFIVVPEKEGELKVSGTSFVYFDHVAERYMTLSVDSVNVSVDKADTSVTPLSLTNQSTPNTASERDSLLTTEAVKTIKDLELKVIEQDSDGLLPRGLMMQESLRMPPVSKNWLFVWAGLPFAAWLLIWFLFAAKRVYTKDESTPRHIAMKQLKHAVKQVRLALNESEIRSALLLWQTHVMTLWAHHNCAPSSMALSDGLKAKGYAHEDTVWLGLWKEAESAVYANQIKLSKDWAERADAALKRVSIPWTAWWKMILPKYLFPLWFSLILVSASNAEAEMPPSYASLAWDAYEQGDFEKAEEEFKILVAETPADWALRNNLALALYQQNKKIQAMAQWISALALNPRAEQVRWNIMLTSDKGVPIDAVIKNLAARDGVGNVMGMASVFEWQVLFVIFCFITAIFLGLICWVTYKYLKLSQHYERIMRSICYTGMSIGFLGILLAGVALWHYGAVADPHVAVVSVKDAQLYSLPTDLVDEQEKTGAVPGSLMIVEKVTPIGWLQVRIMNGATGVGNVGWMRSSQITYLYK
ncbi:MAG: BatD family protein [Verrucomicrobiota bacterium]